MSEPRQPPSTLMILAGIGALVLLGTALGLSVEDRRESKKVVFSPGKSRQPDRTEKADPAPKASPARKEAVPEPSPDEPEAEPTGWQLGDEQEVMPIEFAAGGSPEPAMVPKGPVFRPLPAAPELEDLFAVDDLEPKMDELLGRYEGEPREPGKSDPAIVEQYTLVLTSIVQAKNDGELEPEEADEMIRRISVAHHRWSAGPDSTD